MPLATIALVAEQFANPSDSAPSSLPPTLFRKPLPTNTVAQSHMHLLKRAGALQWERRPIPQTNLCTSSSPFVTPMHFVRLQEECNKWHSGGLEMASASKLSARSGRQRGKQPSKFLSAGSRPLL